jgi:hypothetical protein
MTKRGRIAFSCVGIALLAALAWGAWPRTESVTEVTPDAPRMRCALEAGQTRAFRIVVTPSDSQGERTPLTAELHLRTLAGPSGTTQAADVAGMIVPHTDFEGAENYEEPFLLSVNTKCRFERISFTEATSATQAAVVEGTLRLFEVVGGDTRSPAWEVLQRDANGEYFASYQRSAFDETSLEFTRTSSDYRGPQGDGNSIQQLRFDMTGHFDAERLAQPPHRREPAPRGDGTRPHGRVGALRARAHRRCAARWPVGRDGRGALRADPPARRRSARAAAEHRGDVARDHRGDGARGDGHAPARALRGQRHPSP